MRRRVVEWRWDEPEAQAVFAEWVGFPTREETELEIDTHQGEIVEFRERQRALALADVEAALSAAGFAQVACFADLVKTPATDHQFGVFLGRKD